jgi:hypothetical protein
MMATIESICCCSLSLSRLAHTYMDRYCQPTALLTSSRHLVRLMCCVSSIQNIPFSFPTLLSCFSRHNIDWLSLTADSLLLPLQSNGILFLSGSTPQYKIPHRRSRRIGSTQTKRSSLYVLSLVAATAVALSKWWEYISQTSSLRESSSRWRM